MWLGADRPAALLLALLVVIASTRGGLAGSLQVVSQSVEALADPQKCRHSGVAGPRRSCALWLVLSLDTHARSARCARRSATGVPTCVCLPLLTGLRSLYSANNTLFDEIGPSQGVTSGREQL